MEQFATVADVESHTFVAELYVPTEQLGGEVIVASHSLDVELYVPDEQLSANGSVTHPKNCIQNITAQSLDAGLKNPGPKLIEQVGGVVRVNSHKSFTVLRVPKVHVAGTVVPSSHWFVVVLYVPDVHVGSVPHFLVLGSRIVPSGHACWGTASAVCDNPKRLPDAIGAINNIAVIVKAMKIVLVIKSYEIKFIH